MKTERDSIAVVDAIYEALDPEGNSVSVCRLCSRYPGYVAHWKCPSGTLCRRAERELHVGVGKMIIFELEDDNED